VVGLRGGEVDQHAHTDRMHVHHSSRVLSRDVGGRVCGRQTDRMSERVDAMVCAGSYIRSSSGRRAEEVPLGDALHCQAWQPKPGKVPAAAVSEELCEKCERCVV
jgi:hypothetical protein